MTTTLMRGKIAELPQTAEVLIIEDEAALASALGMVVKRLGAHPVTCASAAVGLSRLNQRRPALVILDIGLPDRSGLEVLRDIRARHATLPTLIVTAHGSLSNAVEAKKFGASEYLVKPLDLQEIERTIRPLLQIGSSEDVPSEPRPDALTTHGSLLIGSAQAMQPAFAAIAHATASEAPVIISGPTGIGKSLAARVIHQLGRRSAGPFVTLSCASLPETLLESELFGHEKGAFTGAHTTKTGHIERAAGGTLFLDEIAEAPLSVQVKLLRLVEEKTFTRVGGRSDLTVDLRVIVASNRDLVEEVAEKRFREDLFYRLRVLEVKLPPLRERMSDLPALCSYLLATTDDKRQLTLSDEAMAILRSHAWPGNVRELRNALEHAAARCAGQVILPMHLPQDLGSDSLEPQKQTTRTLDDALHSWLEDRLAEGVVEYDTLHEELESRLLAALLPRFENKPTLLARELQMNRATLRKKLSALGAKNLE